MLESCRRPDLVTEITLQPVRRHGVDAAIFFSDIVVPLAAVGVDLDIVPGVGPVVAEPVPHPRRPRPAARAHARARPLHHRGGAACSPRELGATPLIGFAGAPFTLASYLVEGGPSQEPRAHQGADVRRPAAVARPVRPARADLRGVPAGAGRGRRLGGAAVRLVGRRAAARRLRARSSSRTPLPRSRAVADLGVPAHPLRRRHRRAARRRWGRPAPTSSGVDYRRLAHRCPRAARWPTTPCRATSTPPCCSRRGRPSRPRCARSSRRAARRPGTSSTSATASCRETDPDVLTRVVELVHEVSAR